MTTSTARRRTVAGPLAAAILTVGAFGWLHLTRPDEAAAAQDACQSFVQAQLASTVRYSNLASTGRGNTWTVTGDVETDGPFLTPVRTHFSCVVQLDGEWRLVSLTGV